VEGGGGRGERGGVDTHPAQAHNPCGLGRPAKGFAVKQGLFLPLLVAACLLALVTMAVACGGNGELTLEEYFEQLDGFLETGDLELARLQTEYLEKPEGAEAWIEAATFQDFCTGVVQHFRRAIAGLESIDPPPLVRGAHDKYIATQVEALHFFAAINDRAHRVSTVDEYIEVLRDARGSVWREIEGREDEWCFALERIGVRSGIEVSLECFE